VTLQRRYFVESAAACRRRRKEKPSMKVGEENGPVGYIQINNVKLLSTHLINMVFHIFLVQCCVHGWLNFSLKRSQHSVWLSGSAPSDQTNAKHHKMSFPVKVGGPSSLAFLI
jgi:hypothetical protein